MAVVTFHRSPAGDGTSIDPALATVAVSAPLGFQPLDLAVVRGDRTQVFAASRDRIPPGVPGVARIDLTGPVPVLAAALDALAPTRLVAAAHLVEADLLRPNGGLSSPVASALDATAFVGTAVDRVYAVLDESGCGLRAEIDCGVVALDPSTNALVLDPTPVGTMHAPYRAPLPTTGGFASALGVLGPPANPPSDLEPQYAGTYMKIAANAGWRASTAAAGVAISDGTLAFVDLARWDIPTAAAPPHDDPRGGDADPPRRHHRARSGSPSPTPRAPAP